MTRPTYLVALTLAGSVHAESPDPQAFANTIDRHLEAAWIAASATPAPPADDATFLRRAYLDLVGHIPTVGEVRAFETDRAPDKRARLIDRLVASQAHARHTAVFWRKTWLPQTALLSASGDGTDDWLAVRLHRGDKYDRIVRDLLTPTIEVRPAGRDLGVPQSFYSANEYKPESLAAGAARAFLGINLDCAQCHNHPFARWTRDQFWQTAAFFTRPAAGAKRLEVKVMDSDRLVGAKLLTTEAVAWPDRMELDTGRRVLADWVTATGNPYFARNAVNRVWAHLFGTGLVEPLDDLSADAEPAGPGLLDDLTKAFIDSGFDLQYLTRAIVRTRAYRLSSVGPTTDPRLFARFPVRGLTGEQLYDSLRVAAGLPPLRTDLDPAAAGLERQRFAARFYVERPVAAERSILQALALMNGKLTSELTATESAPTVRGVVDAPFLDARAKVEALYLAAVGRRPSEDDIARLAAYVETGGADRDPKKALADVFWALLNSSEFNTNH
jgi:hypothetical protein